MTATPAPYTPTAGGPGGTPSLTLAERTEHAHRAAFTRTYDDAHADRLRRRVLARNRDAATPEQDMRERLTPTYGQRVAAAALLADAPVDSDWHVIAPLALPGKAPHVWETGQTVLAAPGAWLARNTAYPEQVAPCHRWHVARAAAEESAAAMLARLGTGGTTGYVVIDRAGGWSAFID